MEHRDIRLNGNGPRVTENNENVGNIKKCIYHTTIKKKTVKIKYFSP